MAQLTSSLSRDFKGALAALDMVVGVRAERSAAKNSPDATADYMRHTLPVSTLPTLPTTCGRRSLGIPGFHLKIRVIRRLDLEEVVTNLKVVHIAGSKGKGSTSAMCESGFRRAGLSTALFSSPHLIDIRERIRINGQLVEEAVFVEHFWAVWDALEAPRGPRAAPATAEVTCFPRTATGEKKKSVRTPNPEGCTHAHHAAPLILHQCIHGMLTCGCRGRLPCSTRKCQAIFDS